jgi:hypothetical protein
MIDRLKLSRTLEARGMPREQAEGVAEGLAEGLQADVGARLHRVEHDLTDLKSEMKLLKWMAGANLALTIGVLLKLLAT